MLDKSFIDLLAARGLCTAVFLALCSLLLAPCSAVAAQEPKVPRIGFLGAA